MKNCSNQAFKDGRKAGLDPKGKARKLHATAGAKLKTDHAEFMRGYAEGLRFRPIKAKKAKAA